MATNNNASAGEQSPLLGSPRQRPFDTLSKISTNLSTFSDDDPHPEEPAEETRSTLYLILLTISIGGLQILWSVELSNGSPYLLSLGMTKALVAFVWLAGPMTGVLVQPYVGMVSDRCRVSWGKRKPFMIAGTLGTVVSSLLLAYARQIVFFIGRFDADAPYEGYWKGGTVIMATILMWCLDFSINTVQASIRAFIVDGAPAHQQEGANAWASRMSGIGNVFGYIAGYLNLPKYFWFLGREQFQVLCAFASIVLTALVSLSIFTIKEKNPQEEPEDIEEEEMGFFTFFQKVWESIQRLPTPIRVVCEIQFFNWMGWFPFLFYITTYIGQLYVNPRLQPNMSPEEVDRLWAQATRIGTFALLVEAVVSLTTNVLLPFLVMPTYQPKDGGYIPAITPTTPIGSRTPFSTQAGRQRPAHRRTTSTYSAASGLFADYGKKNQKTRGSFVERTLSRLQIPGFTLRRAWLFAQLLFSACMFSTFFINDPTIGIIMVAVVGMSWSLTLWAPFALISAEISKRDEERKINQRQKLIDGRASGFYDQEDHEENRAGIILGLHNVAVSAPQVIATLICSVIFKTLQKPRDVPGDMSVAWSLRLAGFATLASAWITWRKLKESVKDEDNEDEEE